MKFKTEEQISIRKQYKDILNLLSEEQLAKTKQRKLSRWQNT
jgi:hypothetical protein